MCKHRNLGVLSTLGAGAVVALVAAACSDRTNLNTAPQRPSFWVVEQTCPPGKWTGGGRIDPPSNPDADDAATGEEVLVPPLDPMGGKFTFGFNVFLASDCSVTKGEIEVNGHALKIAWHVSIHNGVDAFGNHVTAGTFDPDVSGRGVCLVVGLPSSGFMVARVNPGQGSELVQFEVCDNDRGAPQNSRTDAMRWRAANHGDTGLTYLTGGNIVDHGS